MRVAIIGAGLAGTALAYVLKQGGAEPVIYEASGNIASGASGNDVGLYNPRFTAEQGPEQAFYSDAFFKAICIAYVAKGGHHTACSDVMATTVQNVEEIV